MNLRLSSRIALVFSIGTVAAASSGDDFSNNLFSDLAPLLALFGERVAQQFMSQSMGWADNIIFAMAPLGVVTAIVSAIRVGGPTWLKAIIGRARENRAVAEAELMSSTSNEVCELWNGQQIVRIMGSAPIREFICLQPIRDTKSSPHQEKERTADEGGDSIEPIECCTLEKALENGYLKRSDPSFFRHLLEFIEPVKGLLGGLPQSIRPFRRQPKRIVSKARRGLGGVHLGDIETGDNANGGTPKQGKDSHGSGPKSNSSPQFIIIQPDHSSAPNLSLNLHRQAGRAELRVVAALGTLLQLGVILYCGFITYYPRLISKFLKDEGRVKGYAFPLTAAGTLMLVAGMLICCHVVESSTEEERYSPKRGFGAHVLWLQKKMTVSDQSFDSTLIIARGTRNAIMTSRRRGGQSHAVLQNSQNLEDSNISTQAESGLRKESKTEQAGSFSGAQSEILSTIGTFISLCGFITQFVGLRGMHWSATVTQLGATLVMAALRTLVRRGLVEQPFVQPLDPGFELEWLAEKLKGLGSGGQWPKYPPMEKEEQYWQADSEGGAFIGTNDPEEYRPLQPRDPKRSITEPCNLMELRYCLGRHSGWHEPASDEAISIANAIEVVMNEFFPSDFKDYTWLLQSVDGVTMDFNLTGSKGSDWADPYEIEAALSLWLFTIYRKEKSRPDKGVLKKQRLRLLGSYSPALSRDLRWWMTSKDSRIMIATGERPNDVGNKSQGLASTDNWTEMAIEDYSVVGCVRSLIRQGPFADEEGGLVPLWARELPEAFPPGQKTGDAAATNIKSVLAATSDRPLSVIIAQHMFSVFMWAVAKTLLNRIGGKVRVSSAETINVNRITEWQSFTLENSVLSNLARDIRNTGLGNLEESYLSIIPSLSAECKLPRANTIIEMMRQHTEQHELQGRWAEASVMYLWLFQACMTFRREEDITVEATAVLMECLRSVSSAVELRKEQRYEESEVRKLRELEVTIGGELMKADTDIISGLLGQLSRQNREYRLEKENGELIRANNEPFRGSRFTNLHQIVRSWMKEGEVEDELNQGTDVNVEDNFHWTPLHYAAAKGFKQFANTLQKNGANVNAKDLRGWTPLHYASSGNHDEIMWKLLQDGADAGIRARDGATPLHCAANEGHFKAVESLVEAGVDVNALDALRNTPLHRAAYRRHAMVAKYLWQGNDKIRERHGRTPLHLAAIVGHKDTISNLLEGGDIKEKDREGRTVLHMAAGGGHKEAVEMLVEEFKADVEAKDRFGQTAVHMAAGSGHKEVVKLLVEKFKANIEAEGGVGLTALHMAAGRGHMGVMELLVEKFEANIEAKGKDGQTALHRAASSGHKEVVELLIGKLGADVEMKAKDGWTALQKAAYSGHKGVVELLVGKFKADVEAKGTVGLTALHMAVWRGHKEVVELLVEKFGVNAETALHRAALSGQKEIVELLIEKFKANIEVKDGGGLTALHRAAEGGHKEMVELLVEKFKADVEAKDGYGRTVLHRAAGRGHRDVVELLVNKFKADVDAKGSDGQTPRHLAVMNGQSGVEQWLAPLTSDK